MTYDVLKARYSYDRSIGDVAQVGWVKVGEAKSISEAKASGFIAPVLQEKDEAATKQVNSLTRR